MRLSYSLLVVAVLAAMSIVGGLWMPSRSDSAPVPNAVVVTELFTSEGCSSCPPADELLTRLVDQQPLKSVIILALGEHVDYWDRLGWADPFASAANSDRQAQYAARLPNAAGGVYTPQLVIDGAAEAVGSDAPAVTRKIAQAAAQPKAALGLSVLASHPGSLDLKINLLSLPAPLRESSDLMVAVTEDRLASNVRRGENSGRRLEHNSVLRSMQTVATLSKGATQWSGQIPVALLPKWKPSDLKVIAFLQERNSGHIVGTGWIQINPSNRKSETIS
jgi:hypothetical protein